MAKLRLLLVSFAALVLLSLTGCGLSNLLQAAGTWVEATPTPEVIVVTATPEPRQLAAATPTSVVIVVTATPEPRQLAAATPTRVATEPTVATTLNPAAERYRDLQEQLLIEIYERVGPSVVFVTSEFFYYDFFYGQHSGTGSGSGFIIDKQGHIVTNYHVIENANRVDVKLADGTTAIANIVGTDPINDLAVLRIDVSPDKLQAVELGDSASLKVGQLAIAIGNPLGLERSLSVGVVSALGRQVPQEGSEWSLYDVIQTDASINPGNSGGPLLDSQGRVIGVNTAIANVTGASIGIGFAVPVDTVKRVVPELIAKGRYSHPWLGVSGYNVSPALAELLDLPADRGILVMYVEPDGPAARAGIRGPNRQVIIRNQRIPVGGDIIVALDGQDVENIDQLIRYVETKKRVGDVVTVTVIRGSEILNIDVLLGELPAS